jgi:flavorubredoxin
VGQRLAGPGRGGAATEPVPGAQTRAAGDNQSRIQEVADNVFALSQLVDLSKPISWVAPAARGFSPSTAYLVRDGDEAVLMDTGIAFQRATLIEQIRQLLPRQHRLTVCLTRNEPDCVGNLHALVNTFRVTRIVSRTPSHPLDYAGPFSYAYPHIEFDNRIRDGQLVPLAGQPRLKVLDGAIRTLITKWFYDERTGVLFTSDFFTHVLVAEDWTPQTHESNRELQDHIGAKFDWLWMADVTRPLALLDAVMQEHAVQALLPQHGLCVVGAEQVKSAYLQTRQAVAAMGRGWTAP